MKETNDEIIHKYLYAICWNFNIDTNEIKTDIEKVIPRTKMSTTMVVCCFRMMILRLFYKRKNNVSYSEVKRDIFDVMRKLSKQEKLSFAQKLVGTHAVAVLLHLMDVYEEETHAKNTEN